MRCPSIAALQRKTESKLISNLHLTDGGFFISSANSLDNRFYGHTHKNLVNFRRLKSVPLVKVCWYLRLHLVESISTIIAGAKTAGFKHLDLNLGHLTRWTSPVLEDNWKATWHLLNEVMKAHGIKLVQGHAHFVNWEIEDLNTWPRHDELVQRTIVGAGIMGVKTLVINPKTYPDSTWYSRKASLETNIESCRQYAMWARPYNLTLAIENLSEKRQGRRFATGPEELLELLEALDDPTFGICWDTGHAHISGINQVGALKMLAPYLKATHIADNHGENDEHLSPYCGTIEWKPIMKTLADIDYQGAFSFEALFRNYSETNEPYNLFLKQLYELGKHLVAIADNRTKY